jgi:hypothetical protein
MAIISTVVGLYHDDRKIARIAGMLLACRARAAN